MPTDISTISATWDSFLGNAHILDVLQRAVKKNRLPHAMIFSGPPSVGKRTLGNLLAQRLDCLNDAIDGACGVCGSCRKIISGAHPDVREIQPDGANIKIDQIRNLVNEIAYQPFEARYRVAILDSADKMNKEAGNCLLRTLEEPVSRTILILVTTNPYLLLGTIRSRARMLQFGGIPQKLIEDHLVKKAGRTGEEARLAAIFSEGSLGSALSFDSSGYKEIRAQALRFASLLLARRGFAELSMMSAGLAKQKESFPLWLAALAAVLQDLYYIGIAPERIGQRDILAELNQIAHTTSRAAVRSANEAVRRLQRGLLRNVNRQLALEALFLSQIDASADATGA